VDPAFQPRLVDGVSALEITGLGRVSAPVYVTLGVRRNSKGLRLFSHSLEEQGLSAKNYIVLLRISQSGISHTP
jgi:hypothetical protein